VITSGTSRTCLFLPRMRWVRTERRVSVVSRRVRRRRNQFDPGAAQLVFRALSNASILSSPVMSVAFHVRFEVPLLDVCGAGNAWAAAVSDHEFKGLKSKKDKKVTKRIMRARLT